MICEGFSTSIVLYDYGVVVSVEMSECFEGIKISNLCSCRRVKLLMFVCLRVLPLEDRAVPPGQDRYSAAVGRIRPRSSPPVRPQTTLFLRPPLGDNKEADNWSSSPLSN